MGENHGNAQIARMQRFPDAEKREKEGKYIQGRNKGAERHQLRYTAERYNERMCHPRWSAP